MSRRSWGDQRVLIVARSTSGHSNSGGMETSAAALVSALHALGARTALLTTEPGPGRRIEADFQGHERIWTVPTPKPGRYSREWWRATRKNGKWLEWEPTLIVGIGDAAGAFTPRTRNGPPVVIHSHGTTVMEIRSAIASGGSRGWAKAAVNLARTPRRRRHARRVDLILAAGPAIAASLTSRTYGVAAQQVTVLNNSIDVDSYRFRAEARDATRRAAGAGPDDLIWLVVGRLDHDKGVDIAIDAMALAHKTTPLLVVAGTGPATRDLQARASRSPMGDRVTFLGRIPPSEVPSLMAAADVLLFPTRRSEGLPMVALEAAASGLPMVTTRRANLPADLAHGDVAIREATASSIAEAAIHLGAAERVSRLPLSYSVSTYPDRLATALSSILAGAGG